MMVIEPYISAFREYGESFLNDSAQENHHVQLKIDHSLQVLGNAKIIVDHITTERQNGEPALLASLFHDIGRFPQYHQYRTFNDRRSINHGHLGVKVLKKKEIYRYLPSSYRQNILSAIALHNRSVLPRHLTEPLRTICNIVRDSDKIDIFRVMIDHFSRESSDSTVSLEAVPHPTNYTQRMFDNVFQEKPCLYSDIYWTNDFKLVLASWTYKLNFPISYRLFHESGLFDQLFSVLPPSEEFARLKEKLSSVIADRMGGPASGTN